MSDQKPYEPFDLSEPEKESRHLEDPYYDDPSYRGWEKKTIGGAFSQYVRHNGLLLVGIGVGIAALFLLFQLLPTTEIGIDKKQMLELHGRVAQLEENMERLLADVENQKTSDPLAIAAAEIETLTGRLERLEASVMDKVETLAAKAEKVEAPKAAPVPPKPVAASPEPVKPKPAVRAPAAPKVAKRYHTVAPGETLYAISRKYKVSVPQLRRMNNLMDIDVIKSGQRIVVGN